MKVYGWVWLGLKKINGTCVTENIQDTLFRESDARYYTKEDEYLVEVLLTASKKAITRLWYKMEPLTRASWKKHIIWRKKICILRLQKTQFKDKGGKQTDYRTQEEDTTNNTGL